MKAPEYTFILITKVSVDFRESFWGSSQMKGLEGQPGCDKTEAVNVENFLMFGCKKQDSPKMVVERECGVQNFFFLK